MGRRLNTYVHVDGIAYGPESDVPDEVAERITAPGVWVDSDKPAVVPPEKPVRRPAPPKD